MSTIRPLATIAVLAALGIFLALKINEQGPVALDDGSLGTWDEAPAIDPAPLEASQSSLAARSAPVARSAPAQSAAPAFKDAPPSRTPAANGNNFPKLPPLPALPGGLPEATPIEGAAPGGAMATTLSLPAPPAEPPAVTGHVPSLGTTTPAYEASETTPLGGTAFPDNNAAADNAAASRTSLTTPTAKPTAPAFENASPSGFDAAWPLIQSALQRNELTRAHLLLSQWRHEPTLTPNQRADIHVLLDQLAGTVIYSMEHRLEPPHQVQPGETLATIAEQYRVPWRLLGKINGIATPEAVQPGQLLKVVRGPFTAEVSLETNEIVLLLDGRYAGRFPAQIDGAATSEGAWRLDQKRLDTPESPKMVLRGTAGSVVIDASQVATPEHQGHVSVASRDAGELYDILSVGSAVTVRR